jgi:hypothetical protein
MSPEEREKEERKRKKCHLWWPPMFMPAAKGSARTPLGPIDALLGVDVQ